MKKQPNGNLSIRARPITFALLAVRHPSIRIQRNIYAVVNTTLGTRITNITNILEKEQPLPILGKPDKCGLMCPNSLKNIAG
jgi:hypothetical protein